MGQENAPRFSHITVGQQDADGLLQPEEEEVIAIGAVDVEPTPSPAASATDAPASDYAQPVVVEEQDSPRREAKEQPAGKSSEQTAEDLGLNVSMSFAQKLVVVACFIGLIGAIAYLVWFWTTQ
jgi:hypothetical protein